MYLSMCSILVSACTFLNVLGFKSVYKFCTSFYGLTYISICVWISYFLKQTITILRSVSAFITRTHKDTHKRKHRQTSYARCRREGSGIDSSHSPCGGSKISQGDEYFFRRIRAQRGGDPWRQSQLRLPSDQLRFAVRVCQASAGVYQVHRTRGDTAALTQ